MPFVLTAVMGRVAIAVPAETTVLATPKSLMAMLPLVLMGLLELHLWAALPPAPPADSVADYRRVAAARAVLRGGLCGGKGYCRVWQLAGKRVAAMVERSGDSRQT